MPDRWDVLVVGAGPGGYVAAIRAAQLGRRTAIVERDRIGGVCLNWGCIPTKALIHGVSLYHAAKGARQAGIMVNAEVDLEGLVRFSRRAADNLSKGVAHLLRQHRVTVIPGHARLRGPHTVEVTDAEGRTASHEATGIILATGSRPRILPGLEEGGDAVMDSSAAMVPKSLPGRLVVIGGGAIGVEFAYIYAALGVKVVIVEMLNQLLPTAEAEIGEELAKAFRRMGVEVLVGTRLSRLEHREDGVNVRLAQGDTELVRQADRVLIAVGVRPNIEDIGLESAGITLRNGFIEADRFGHTKVADIYAIGDVVGGMMLAHKASAQGMVVAARLAGLDIPPVDPALIPSCCYCEPQVAQVGRTSRELDEAGIAYRAGTVPFAANGKAMATASRIGFVKLLFSSDDDRLLGAHLIGAHVSEMISGLALALREGVTAERLGRLVHPHPSLSETIMEAANAAGGRAIHV
ncbi:dihydrolipoyl dehydrogenase [Candidatus Fermentibacteria bacterium]|nr:dihydrolipoyl dehydrogenase [Candidatus Fermentibacteria bacterium]